MNRKIHIFQVRHPAEGMVSREYIYDNGDFTCSRSFARHMVEGAGGRKHYSKNIVQGI